MVSYGVVVVGMFRLAADSVLHLPVRLSPVVVTGPHGDVGDRGTWSYDNNETFFFASQPAYPQYSEQQ